MSKLIELDKFLGERPTHKKLPWKIGAIESGKIAIDSDDDEQVTGWIDPEDAFLILNQQQRIEELERKNNWLKAAMNKYSEDEILCSLQADNVQLHEALEDAFNKISQMCFEGEWTGIETTINKIRKILATTPKQSLARLRNGVLEEAAKKADAFDAFTAKQIRAMKEPA